MYQGSMWPAGSICLSEAGGKSVGTGLTSTPMTNAVPRIVWFISAFVRLAGVKAAGASSIDSLQGPEGLRGSMDEAPAISTPAGRKSSGAGCEYVRSDMLYEGLTR